MGRPWSWGAREGDFPRLPQGHAREVPYISENTSYRIGERVRERTVLIGGIPLFQYLLLLNLGLDPLILREIPSCIGSRVRTFFGFRLICLRCWGISVPRMSQCPFPSGNGGHRGPSHFRAHRGKKGVREGFCRGGGQTVERGRESLSSLWKCLVDVCLCASSCVK